MKTAEELPHIDEQSVEVDAPRERVWRALTEVMPNSRRGAERVAGLLGCADRRSHGDIGRPGSTIVGFRVHDAREPERLALIGRHHFSEYALTFSIDDLGGSRSRVRAATDADFPGRVGSLYRGLVIGSRIHVLAMRSTLAAIKQAAES